MFSMDKLKGINLGRFNQDRGFWLFVLLILVAFALLYTGSAVRMVLMLLSLVIAITVPVQPRLAATGWAMIPLPRRACHPESAAHLDPMGSLMMLITTITGFGINRASRSCGHLSAPLRAEAGNGIVSWRASQPTAALFAVVGRWQRLEWNSAVLEARILSPYQPGDCLQPSSYSSFDGFSVLIAFLSYQAGLVRNAIASLEDCTGCG